MTTGRIILLAFIVANAGGCEAIYGYDICGVPYLDSDVRPFYAMSYNGNTDETRVRASLGRDRDFGSVRPCGGAFYYAGESLDTDDGEFFSRTFPGRLDDRSFVYSGNGISIGHQVHQPRFVAMPDDIQTIDISQAYELAWDGPPLRDGEWIDADIKLPESDDYWHYTQYRPESSTITLFALESPKSGASSIIFSRTEQRFLDDGTKIRARYTKPAVPVQLIRP